MQKLKDVTMPVVQTIVRKDTRVFALLGKATPSGIAPFGPEDLADSWAVTAECGCLRLERMSGYEEVTGLELFLPNAFSYDFGIAGANASPALTRAVFGLLPSELEQIVTVLRRGSFPVLGFSRTTQKCSVSSGIIPGCWPHVVLSNQAVYGNVVSVETFVRMCVASLPEGKLAARFPALQPVLKQMMSLIISQRRGLPCSNEVLHFAPADMLAAK